MNHFDKFGLSFDDSLKLDFQSMEIKSLHKTKIEIEVLELSYEILKNIDFILSFLNSTLAFCQQTLKKSESANLKHWTTNLEKLKAITRS